MTTKPPAAANPRRVEAGRRNRAKRGPLTEAGRERLRQSALKHRPWEHSTGPRTPEGKAQAASNGKKNQRGPRSVREVRAELKALRQVLRDMRQTRRQVAGG